MAKAKPKKSVKSAKKAPRKGPAPANFGNQESRRYLKTEDGGGAEELLEGKDDWKVGIGKTPEPSRTELSDGEPGLEGNGDSRRDEDELREDGDEKNPGGLDFSDPAEREPAPAPKKKVRRA